MVSAAAITGFGTAVPPATSQADLWSGFFAGHYAQVGRGLAERVFANAGVTTRHAVVNPLVEDVSRWSTGQRMERYLTEALPLGRAAVAEALRDAGLAAADVGLLVVCSCTGYVTPGLDILLADELGFAPDARRVFVGHMGCYAALPGLGVAADFVALHGRPAVLLCVELPSLHVQPPSADLQQVVAHALFSDAAAAVVLVPDGDGPRVADIGCRTDARTANYMTWQVTDLGFRMGLSPRVPAVLARHVQPLVADLLDHNGLDVGAVAGWAVHPGGPRILDVVAAELGLPTAALATSRAGLATHGNCSSPTVLLLAAHLRAARPTMLLAFGPGLTLYAGLLT